MTQHKQNDHATIAARLKDLAKIEAVLIEVGQRVILEHARAGRSIPVWRNNQVVWERIEEGERRLSHLSGEQTTGDNNQ